MRNCKFFHAGAGSGKTYKLTHLILDDISKSNCLPNQLILSTFTKAAAAEFKSKATELLIEKGKVAEAAQLQLAMIGTVHSVAEKMIRKFCFKLGLSPEISVIDESDQNFYISQALANQVPENTIAKFEEAMNLVPSEFTSGNNGTDRWKYDLKKVIDLKLTNRIEDLRESKEKSLKLFEQVFNVKDAPKLDDSNVIKTRITALLNYEISNGATTTASENRKIALQTMLNRNPVTFDDLTELRKALKLFDTAGHKKAFDWLAHYLIELENIFSTTKYTQIQKDYISLIFDTAMNISQVYLDFKRTNRLIDFADMESLFLKLLEDTEVQEEIKESFKRVYVDEFQDSNPIQFQLMSKLSDLVDYSYWVGDPKQSIYGFRGTNPDLIDAIARHFQKPQEDEMLEFSDELNQSWRSRSELVEFTNAVFTKVFDGQFVEDQVKLKPVIKVPSNSDQGSVPVQHWHFLDKLNSELANKLKCILNQSTHIIDKVSSRFDEENQNLVWRDLQASDIAILCWSNDHIKRVQEELKSQGIPVNEQKTLFSETIEFELLQAALELYLNPTNALSKAKLLNISGSMTMVDLVSSRLSYIRDHADDSYGNLWLSKDNLPTELSGFDVIGKSKISPLYATILQVTIRTGLFQWLENLESGTLRADNLLRMIMQTEKYLSRCKQLNLPATIHGYLVFLAATEFSEKGTTASSKGVNVITYHGSKGLEWPMVILTDFDQKLLDEQKFAKNNILTIQVYEDNPVSIDDPFKEKWIGFIPRPVTGNTNIPQFYLDKIKELKIYEKRKAAVVSELKRVLYVGFTRARDVLVTTSEKAAELPLASDILKWEQTTINQASEQANADGKKKRSSAGKSKKVWKKEGLYAGLDPGIASRIQFQEIENKEQDETQAVSSEAVWQIHGTQDAVSFFEPKYISPSQAKDDKSYVAVQLTDFQKRILISGNNTEDADLGTGIHAIFAAYQSTIQEEAVNEILIGHNLTEVFPRPAELLTAAASLYQFLEKQYGKAVKLYREIPLQMDYESQIIRGEADLLWETNEELILVDYKTYQGGRDRLLNPEDDHYAGKYGPQLSLYRRMIEAGHPKGKKVSAMLVYYVVGGFVVEIKEQQ